MEGVASWGGASSGGGAEAGGAPGGPTRSRELECCGPERGLLGKGRTEGLVGGRGRVCCSNRVRSGWGRQLTFQLAGCPSCPCLILGLWAPPRALPKTPPVRLLPE